MALLDDDFGDFSSAVPVCNAIPEASKAGSDFVQLDSSLALSLNGNAPVDNGLLTDDTDKIATTSNVPDFSVLQQQWDDIDFNFERSGNMHTSSNVDSSVYATTTGIIPDVNSQTADSLDLSKISWPIETQIWPSSKERNNSTACSSHHQTEYSLVTEPLTPSGFAEVDMKESHFLVDDFGEFESNPIDTNRQVFHSVTEAGKMGKVQPSVPDANFASFPVDNEFGVFLQDPQVDVKDDAKLKLNSLPGVDEFGDFASHVEISAPPPSTIAGVPSLSTSAGVPSLSTSAGVPSLSTSAGVPSLSTIAGVPSLSTSAGVPSLSTSAGVPSLSTSAGVPSLSTSAGVPSLSTSAGVPSLSTSAGVPSLSTSAGVPSLSTSAGVPSLSTSAGVPSLSTSVSLICNKATVDVLNTAFPPPMVATLSESVGTLAHLLDHTPSTSMCSWKSLQKSVDLTVPLYKWDKSYLQEMYLSSLKMSTVMSGASENLLDSFGFDAVQTPLLQTQPTSLPLHRTEVSEDSLLDLGSPTEKRSGDAKLINGAKHGSPEHGANTHPSLWLDPQLCEVEVHPGWKPSLPVSTAPQGAGQPLMSSQHRLSPSAQAILENLPDLSFMLMAELATV